MAISFSGLASGMDTSSWVEALVSVKQTEINKLESSKATISAAQDTLNNIKNYFSSFESLLLNITDSNKFSYSQRDLFTSNLAESSNVSVLTAVANNHAENTTYNIDVKQLATATEVNSGINMVVPHTVSENATLDSKLFSLGDSEHEIHAGDITFTVDGYDRTISIDENSTIASFIDSLDSIGIDASYNAESGIFSIGISVDEDAVTHISPVSDTTGIISALHLQDVNYGYKTNTINIISTTTVTGTATMDSKLKDLGVDPDECNFRIVTEGKITTNDGNIRDLEGTTVANITNFTQESTLGDVCATLETYGIHATINSEGTLTLTTDRQSSSTSEGEKITYNTFQGSLAEALGFHTTEEPEVVLTKMFSTAIVHSTIETVINRDSTLGQIGAVTNSGDTLIIRECDGGEEVETITTLTANSTVQDLFNTLTAYGITGTINDGVITLNSTSGNFIDGNIATNIGILQPIMDTYYTTAPITMTSTSDFNTSRTLGALGMSSDGSVVINSPVYGVVSVNIAKELTVQGFCDKINDSNYGIKAEIVGNRVQISELGNSGAYVKGMSSVLQTTLKLNVGEDASYDSTTINVYSNTDSGYIKYDDTGVEIDSNTVISSINGYTQGNGELLLHQNGVVSTITVDSSLTLEEFINNPIVGLAQYGLSGQILSDGKAYITSNNNVYVEEVTGGSNILSALNMSNLQTTWNGNHVDSLNAKQFTLTITTTVAATKDTALSTWNYETVSAGTTTTVSATGSLVFKVNDYYKTVNLSDEDTFNSLINKLSENGINASISKGVFYISSEYNNVEFIADESTSKLADLIHLGGPENLGGYAASSSPVISTVTTNEDQRISAVNYADMYTTLDTFNISSGKLTVYRNGQKADIDISETWTFDRLQQELTTKFGDLRISFANPNDAEATPDGFLRIYSTDSSANISIGSTSDQTNFVAITGISSTKNSELTSSRQLYKMNDRTAIGDEDLFRTLEEGQKVTSGYFKVGNAEIWLMEENGKVTTTMADIVSQINASEESLAKAYWDSIDGKLVIKSTLTGASAINIESGTTNFTDILGLTDNDSLIMSSQNIGQNAILTINGTTYTSLSNNVTSDSTGITGLTLNLKGLTKDSSVQLTVKRDTETLTNAVQNVIDGYNELMSNIDTVIAKDGKLKNQTMLKLIRGNIRTAMMSSYSGLTTAFKNLSQIGIKSSNASAGNISTSNSDITTLSLDAEAFMKAFNADEEGVKLLLIGDGSEENKGILGQVYKMVFDELSTTGFFDSANKAYNTQKETYTKKIVNGTTAMEKYRKRLENKFSSMDMMIAQMQNQFQSFLS